MANNNNVIDEYNEVKKYKKAFEDFLKKGRKPLSDADAKLCVAVLEKRSKIAATNKAEKRPEIAENALNALVIHAGSELQQGRENE